MQGQRVNGLQQEIGDRPKDRILRKPYSSPQLQEWGSIHELTQGPTFTHTDFPKGGSRPA